MYGSGQQSFLVLASLVIGHGMDNEGGKLYVFHWFYYRDYKKNELNFDFHTYT